MGKGGNGLGKTNNHIQYETAEEYVDRVKVSPNRQVFLVLQFLKKIY